jgi:catechol 2,3-dioxygenase-like lactoylglutathione lyase family enzyme
MTTAAVGPVGLLTEIDHVAIAVNDLEAAVKYYEDVYGATVDHREIVESDGVEEVLLKVAGLTGGEVLGKTRRGSASHWVPGR